VTQASEGNKCHGWGMYQVVAKVLELVVEVEAEVEVGNVSGCCEGS
jgi:hypothetical protein